MIARVQISNYRVLGQIDASLGRLNLVVGPNGSGKSTLLQFLDATLTKANLPFSAPSGMEYQGVVASIERSGSMGVDRICIENGAISRFPPEALRTETGEKWISSPVMLVKFDINAMRKPVFLTSEKTFALDGSNLPAVIADAVLEDYSAFDRIRSDLQRIVPSIRDIKVKRIPRDNRYELQFDTQVATGLDAKFMSDGTLFTLGLLTFLHMVGGTDALFLIDDIDQGLHPLAQRELVGLLRGILDANPNYQIVATTHSPYLLACVQSEEVLCMHLGEDGLSRLAPLTAHPDFARWREEMNPGEFWSLFGDEWVADASAASSPVLARL